MSRFKLEKEFEHKGLKCVVLFGSIGHRNGYVAVGKTHPLFGKDYDEVNDYIDVHGGLTFASGSEQYPVPSSNLWWFGFDCAHWGDEQDFEKAIEYFPENRQMLEIMRSGSGGTIRTQEYVEQECMRLAEQLIERG